MDRHRIVGTGLAEAGRQRVARHHDHRHRGDLEAGEDRRIDQEAARLAGLGEDAFERRAGLVDRIADKAPDHHRHPQAVAFLEELAQRRPGHREAGEDEGLGIVIALGPARRARTLRLGHGIEAERPAHPVGRIRARRDRTDIDAEGAFRGRLLQLEPLAQRLGAALGLVHQLRQRRFDRPLGARRKIGDRRLGRAPQGEPQQRQQAEDHSAQQFRFLQISHPKLSPARGNSRRKSTNWVEAPSVEQA
jgi:hypothetical protein